MMASTMPIITPSTVEVAARISVFFKPTVIMVGSTSAMAFQSRKLRRRFSSQFIRNP
ncbi:hypothetical protein QE435_000375 [Rhizobium sp. SORGH_AS 787]|nr:hypothetical protein [Rhizobium sp. SORGH_AS_0787]